MWELPSAVSYVNRKCRVPYGMTLKETAEGVARVEAL